MRDGGVGRAVDGLAIAQGRFVHRRRVDRSQALRFGPERLGIGRGRILGSHPLVDADDQTREGAQPDEVFVAEDQLQPLAAGVHASVRTLVGGALGIEQCLVQPEETIAKLLQTIP